jgi:hypothetical protein
MDGHALIAHVAFCSTIGDGGPRRYHSRGKSLPEKYLPGRCLAGMRANERAAIVRALADTTPAPWFVRVVVEGVEPPRGQLVRSTPAPRGAYRGRVP